MKLVKQFSNVLCMPEAYRKFRSLIGTQNCWRTYLREYVKPIPGEKVLDLGCGPADVLEYLPEVDYTGMDISPRYIDAAKKRFGSRGRFLCADVAGISLREEQGTFDLVLATGVLHHLNDAEALNFFDLACRAMRAGGRLVTFDGCFVPKQSSFARWVLRNDRGKFVRGRDEYERLALSRFGTVTSRLVEDLLRIPYTHLIMRCRNKVFAQLPAVTRNLEHSGTVSFAGSRTN